MNIVFMIIFVSLTMFLFSGLVFSESIEDIILINDRIYVEKDVMQSIGQPSGLDDIGITEVSITALLIGSFSDPFVELGATITIIILLYIIYRIYRHKEFRWRK